MTIAKPVLPGILRGEMRYLPFFSIIFFFGCATEQTTVRDQPQLSNSSRALVSNVCAIQPAATEKDPVDLVSYLDAHATPNQTTLAPIAPPLVNLGNERVMIRVTHEDDWGESSRLLCTSVRTLERVRESENQREENQSVVR